MNKWAKLVASIFIFTTTGPVIGLTIMTILAGANNLHLSLSGFVNGMVVVLSIGLLFAYLMAAIPALITGIVFGMITALKELSRLLSFVIGFASGFVITLLWFSKGDLGLDGSLGWAVYGGISGACCGVITKLITSRPNNSFKRTAAAKFE